jgi:hypothetical protein
LEVEVKNDGFVDGGPAVIVGDFIAGEEAAAWLTSPCDGNIVAVQIAWLEGSPGHGQSLEQAIHIYAAGSFPTPGGELEILEGPVMTPGYINEFRYLDQAQTIPLSVPVTAGQTFVVSLEYFNPTDVGNGGPSVIRDTDGCQNRRNALFAIPGGWLNFCLFLNGDLVIRAIVDCAEPQGACCDPAGFCTNGVLSGDCQGPGETFFEGQDCAQVICPAPTGACCNGTGGCLDGQEQSFCENVLSSIYAGDGTTCAAQVCDLGACCLADGSCQDVIEAVCDQLAGTFNGPGSNCASTQCPQPLGACCIGNVCVPDQTEANCIGFGGTWQGAWTDCGPPDPCTPTCDVADLDCDGDVDLNDFSTFSRCYAGSSVTIPPPACSSAEFAESDIDGDGDVDLGDFNTFALNFTG